MHAIGIERLFVKNCKLLAGLSFLGESSLSIEGAGSPAQKLTLGITELRLLRLVSVVVDRRESSTDGDAIRGTFPVVEGSAGKATPALLFRKNLRIEAFNLLLPALLVVFVDRMFIG